MSGNKGLDLDDVDKYTNWFGRIIDRLEENWSVENLNELCDVVYLFVLPHACNLSVLNDYNEKLIKREMLGMFNIVIWTEEDKRKLLGLCKSVYGNFEEYNNMDI